MGIVIRRQDIPILRRETDFNPNPTKVSGSTVT